MYGTKLVKGSAFGGCRINIIFLQLAGQTVMIRLLVIGILDLEVELCFVTSLALADTGFQGIVETPHLS
jgi:hypothetical protein